MAKNSERQPNWDIYEAAILLDGYLESIKKEQPKSQIVKRISAELRNMAINRGLKIDAIYRNENGISYQIQSIESAYKGYKVYVHTTKLFDEVVYIYRNNYDKYIEILKVAREMASAKSNTPKSNNRDAFFAWAASVLPAHKCKWLEENILKIQQLAIDSKIIFGSIFDVTNMVTLRAVCRAAENDKLFKVKYRKIIKSILADFKTYMQYCSKLPMHQMNEAETHILEFSKKSATAVSALTNLSISDVCEAKFRTYLLNTAKLAENTCKSYISSIRYAERYAADKGYKTCSLFTEDSKIIIATTTALCGDPEFLRYNEQQHNRLSAAINKLLESIGETNPKGFIPYTDNDSQSSASLTRIDLEISTILRQHYEFGFKYNSIRELMRFRQFAETAGITLPDDDEALKNSIISSGTIIDDRVYCKNDDMAQDLQRMVDDAFSTNASVIYYEKLFQKEHEWMLSHAIVSSDILKKYLKNNIAECSFSKKFMVKGGRRSENEAVTEEIKRIWGGNSVQSLCDLENNLPYIPLNNILRVISGNSQFALADEGKYLFIDRFYITKDEENDILNFVSKRCEKNGFASLCDIPLGDIEENNYELTKSTIYDAIFKKILSGKYHLNGKILTNGEIELDAVTILKQYLKDKDECTFEAVMNKVIELTGSSNRQYAFQALYDDMVRVDRDKFVNNRFVHFSIDEIDTVLKKFITDNFRAIKDVTTFALFPLCGQNWNHYLLESFCYKYSKKYSLHLINFNDKNAGIIAEKNYIEKYEEMLAIALQRDNVELSPVTIGQYLFNAGYIAKRKYAKLDEIAQRAAQLRKER